MTALTATKKRRIPTTQEVLLDQKKQAERERALVPAEAPAHAPTWLDEGGSGAPGRQIKFNGKDGQFLYTDTKEPVGITAKFVARCDQVLIGRIKFGGPGSKPDKRGELWHPAFRLPPRDTLDEQDEAKWGKGLNGLPRDPWQEFVELILLQDEDVYCFTTMTVTGQMAVRILLRHYTRMCRKEPDREVYPVVSLVPGGYKGQSGWVHTPTFLIVGTTAKADPAKVAPPSEDFNDEIAF